MIEQERLYDDVIEYLRNLGYGVEMIKYEVSTSYDSRIDLVVESGKDKFIAVEIKSQSDIFTIPHSEVQYHPVARKLQRDAMDIGVNYYFVTNGHQAIWLKTAENGRPQVIEPVYSSDIISNKQVYSEYIESIINHGIGFLERLPITGDISFDLSMAIFTKIRKDMQLPFDISLDKSLFNLDEIDFSTKKSVLFKLVDSWKEIDFYKNRIDVLMFIDKYLEKNRFELQIPRWLADFMVNFYPDNEVKKLALDLFTRSGTLISSAHNSGWRDVKGYYFNKSSEYWIKSQQLLSSGKESIVEFNPNLLINDFSDKVTVFFDCVLLAPPFGLRIDSEYGFDKKDSVELLISKALNNTKNGGFVIAIVPDGILLSSRYNEFRKTLIKEVYIKGIINLTPEAFKPYSTVATSILILQNKPANTESTFMASIDELPAKGENENIYYQILNNWKSFCKKKSFEQGRNGFIVNKLISNNLHSSNYWFKDNHFGMETLRDGFQAIPLREIAIEIKRGKTYKRDKNEEIPYLSPAVIRKMKLIESELSYTSTELEPLSPIRVYEGDIVINIIGTQRGSAGIIDKNYSGLGINHHLIVVKPNLNIVNPYYLAIALNSDYVQKQLQEGSTGTVIPSLSLKSFESIYIPIPPLDIQDSICEKYRNILNEIDKMEKELKQDKQKLKNILSEVGKGELI